jgi:hypothetical protein
MARAPNPNTQPRASAMGGTRRTPAPRSVLDEMVPNHRRSSRDLIYESMMRGGGEPFGAPYASALPTLIEKIVRKFRQRSFFSFETFEKSGQDRKLNKFTRYGASRYRGDYKKNTP